MCSSVIPDEFLKKFSESLLASRVVFFSITHPESGQAFSSVGVGQGGLLGALSPRVGTSQGTWSRYSVSPASPAAPGVRSGWVNILDPQHHGVCCPSPGCQAHTPEAGCPMVQGMDQMQRSVLTTQDPDHMDAHVAQSPGLPPAPLPRRRHGALLPFFRGGPPFQIGQHEPVFPGAKDIRQEGAGLSGGPTSMTMNRGEACQVFSQSACQ